MAGALKALEGFSSYIEQQMDRWKVPGLAVAVIKDQEIVMAEGYGFRNAEAGLKVTPETMFAIGSCTKAFTALAAGQLADEGKLDLDAPVKTYLPHFKMHDAVATERITVRDMLCHRSGLPRHDLMWYNSELTREEIIERLAFLEPNQDFRAKWQYQNIMYTVAGYLVGQLAGASWEQIVQERIFKPLRMTSSCFSVEDLQLRADYALPYIEKDGKVLLTPFRNLDAIGPAGSINSNIIDMANWVMLHLSKGVFDGQQIVTEGSLAGMHTPHMPCDPSVWGKKELPISCYGLGWGIEPYRGHHMIHHGGGIDGFSSFVSFLPHDHIGVVILTNKNATSLPLIASFNLFDRLLGLEEMDWNGRIEEDLKKWKEQLQEQKEKERQNVKELKSEIESAPPHPLIDYTGTYEHPGYGKASIELENGRLQLMYNSLTLPMTHLNDDVFEIFYERFEAEVKGTFYADSNGNILRFSVPMNIEPGAKEIEFTKN
ncbi:serine hydrolase [Paenibacillus apiarius]|uniref:Serine hydrolase n=1 Tax=Paenibacillus apiarius TaxID=46240 RepID=A0ABT4DUQ6_9BACL|nr:serine hydrolase [Paenibacillus apiarius]MCY9514385.1 serine hydrolase [Paenibacillus apiarius]MCY9521077.1 serine hydrolase [Paenibacillus apiarius]MCY9551924.1 serine hydrolase [Paenibacillus apiarius]MCY9557811.1 serine hydrolase [Paenibacillus apiarius]MCY9684498.1 serine hydrolase [Paenibacillus apiarius]